MIELTKRNKSDPTSFGLYLDLNPIKISFRRLINFKILEGGDHFAFLIGLPSQYAF